MKRTIISTMCIVAALVLASSCNKIEEIIDPGDNTNTEENLGRTIINGVVESIGTKAELSYGYDVVWNTGDKIYVTAGAKDDTFTLSAGEGTTKGKFTEDSNKGITGNIEAFYPASLKTDDGYVWPAVQANNQVAPMYAKQTITGAEGETVSFSSLGAMLQIGFNTQTNDIVLTSITLKDGNKPLSGKFTVTDGQAVLENNSAKPGITLDLGDGVPVGLTPKYFYIAIPAGKYQNLTITFNSEDGKVCEMNSRSFPEVKGNTVGRLTLTGSFKKAQTLPGIFSLGNGVKAHFSCGNLYCIGDPQYYYEGYQFAFENNQYDYRTRSGILGDKAMIDGEKGYTPGGTSGLFQWFKDLDPTKVGSMYIGVANGSHGAFSRLDKDQCSGEAEDIVDFSGTVNGGWSALSQEEWTYLTSGRTDANKLYNLNVTVNGVNGAVIAPDDWDTTNYPIVGTSSYDKSTWSRMESMGLVFFPTVGYMYTGENGTDEPRLRDDNYYWLSTGYHSDRAVCMDFRYGGVDANGRFLGLPVRLVKRYEEQYTVTFDANGHGVAPAPITGLKYGSMLNEPEMKAKDAVFHGWFTDKYCHEPWNFEYDFVDRNITLYAGWIELPNGALSGAFTVNSDGKQVHFSMGNLWADASGDYAEDPVLHFETNQYDFNSLYETSHVSHLLRASTVAEAVGIYDRGDYLFCEEGHKVSVDGSNATYYALSRDEWSYLIKSRDYAYELHKTGVTVCGQPNCLIIAPDDWDRTKYPLIGEGSLDSYDASTWHDAEVAGLVCLPSAGYRYDEDVYDAGLYGYYWSSTGESMSNTYALYFINTGVLHNWYHMNTHGSSIRLVTTD